MSWIFPLIILITVAVGSKLWRIGHRERGLPPGPPTTFLVGNALEFPKEFPHIRHMQWAAEFGEIFSLKLFHMTVVVLNSAAAVRAVLDKQGHATGDRPQSHLVKRSTGEEHIVFSNMNTHTWRTTRKAIHTFLTPEALTRYWPMQQAEYHKLLRNIHESPQETFTHLRVVTASVMMSLVYGQTVSSYHGTKAELYYEGSKRLAESSDIFAHPPVDLIPILKYVPERWAKWKRFCNETRVLRESFDEDLFAHCEKNVMELREPTCYLEKVMESGTSGMTRDELRAMGVVLLDGGTETSASFLQSFTLAMICHPHCQTKAQEEIDRVIGDRMPLLEDFEDLPYLKAAVKELHRFRTVFPVALPHVATQNLQYNDYVIPEGTLIFMNTWGIFHDPQLYDDPNSYVPERFLQSELGVKSGADTSGFRDTLPFGAGRRICPGTDMATRTISMNVMNLLWAFRFTKGDEASGRIDIDNYVKPGVELAPKDFVPKVEVRSEKRMKLVLESLANA